ncbi:hypothetical protein HQ865_08545 [Mucilaginibacter mali]|uniref:Cytochrome oxidase complex assembly protein 1 n=1 Tax=Mucilaginibacter mali TaxID=2740462 RepID=A0A7D4PTM1_9SPHI|nr:hypothetical protein [Mucilaginibacter mali]QKJ29803.1 hypothetical protein HQ865_08545 [Mucilaginibacter mali]
MAKTNYVDSKAGKKKTAKKAGWVLVLLGIIFIFILLKFASNSGLRFSTGGLPTGDEAFAVAKDFVKATVRSSNVDFPGSGYQIGKKSDSVYVIKSVTELTSENGDKRRTNFKVMMEYHGGKQTDMKNWSLLNISEEQ